MEQYLNTTDAVEKTKLKYKSQINERDTTIKELETILDNIKIARGKWHRKEIDDRETVEQVIEALQGVIK